MRLKHRLAWALAAGVSLAALPILAEPRQPPGPVTAAAAVPDGRALLIEHGCSQCHGLEGQGAPMSGPRIGPNPIALAAFIRYIRAPRGQMPPYTVKVMSDSDVAAVHRYLASRRGPAPQTLLPPD